MARSDSTDTSESYSASKTDWMYALAIAISAGVVVVAVLGLANDVFGRLQALMGGLMLAGASGLVGAFMGFLFGIPRSKQLQGQVLAEDGNSQREYLENTNLEQISDWLTKIIVGLTLVQFNELKTFVTEVGKLFSPVFLSVSQSETAGAIGVAVILYFTIAGFLFGFLWTRIHLENVLRQQSAIGLLDVKRIWEGFQEQADTASTTAYELTDDYLDPSADPNAEKFDNLKDKIARSSPVVRAMIFDRARKVRRDNWRAGGDHNLIERTVPIFEGLIIAKHGRQHRNYGQLGYALNATAQPNWAAAQEALEKALELQGEDDSGRGYYELNLAIALINQDPAFLVNKASGVDSTNRITELLVPAGQAVDLNDVPAIAKWAKLNGYPISMP